MSLLTRSEIEGYLKLADTAPVAERAKIQKLLEFDRRIASWPKPAQIPDAF